MGEVHRTRAVVCGSPVSGSQRRSPAAATASIVYRLMATWSGCMKRNGGSYTPFGQGDSPIKEVLQLLSKEKWDIPCSIEYEYNDPDGTMAAMEKCLKYCKDALA